jgi:F-type H+-transporting ATPase subunit b
MSIVQIVIIQVVAFLAIVFSLRKIMYSVSAGETNRLKQLNQESVEHAKNLALKREDAEKICKEKIAKAEEEINKFKAQAKEEIRQLREEVLAKARLESERVVDAANKTKDHMREEVMDQMEDKAIDFAVQIFKETFFSKAKKSIHQELVKGVTKEVEEIDDGKFDIEIEKGELISAYPLEVSQREKVLPVVFKKLKYKIPFDEKEDKGLAAGIMIKLGTLVIDGSLSNKLRQVVVGYKK